MTYLDRNGQELCVGDYVGYANAPHKILKITELDKGLASIECVKTNYATTTKTEWLRKVEPEDLI